jgi:hypothetical protein
MCNLYAWREAVIVAVCVLGDGRTALKGPCAMSDTFINGMDDVIWRVTAITLLVTEGVLSRLMQYVLCYVVTWSARQHGRCDVTDDRSSTS